MSICQVPSHSCDVVAIFEASAIPTATGHTLTFIQQCHRHTVQSIMCVICLEFTVVWSEPS